MSDSIIEKVMSDHKKTMNDLSARQLANRQNQDARLKVSNVNSVHQP